MAAISAEHGLALNARALSGRRPQLRPLASPALAGKMAGMTKPIETLAGVDATAFAAAIAPHITRSATIAVSSATDDLAAGVGAFRFPVPETMDGKSAIKIKGWLTTASTAGVVEVQIHNETTGQNLLSTKLTIDQGALTSTGAAVAAVIDAAQALLAAGQILRIDVTLAGTGARGLKLEIVAK